MDVHGTSAKIHRISMKTEVTNLCIHVTYETGSSSRCVLDADITHKCFLPWRTIRGEIKTLPAKVGVSTGLCKRDFSNNCTYSVLSLFTIHSAH